MRVIEAIKENGFFLPTLKYKELMLLDYIEEHPDTTQKELGKIIGSATSMVNTYLDEYESSGYVKREYISSKTVRYIITNKGQVRKNFLNISYLQELITLHNLAQKGIEDFLEIVSKKGFKNILLYGAGEVAEIILSVLRDNTDLGIQVEALVDDNLEKRGTTIQGYPVISKMDIKKYEHDGILISSYAYETAISKQLDSLGYCKDKVIHFFSGQNDL